MEHLGPNYNLKVIKPDLAKEWHPTKNGKLSPYDVTPGSAKKVWWRCKKGHEWRALIKKRSIGNKCPYCSRKKASKEYNLALINPKLAKEWNIEKNKDLTQYDVTPKADRKAWWKCPKCGHDWEARINNRSKGTGCPKCSKKNAQRGLVLADHYPKLTKQWYYLKNHSLFPQDVTAGSKKTVWWKCLKGHVWQAKIQDRKKGIGCPYCSGKKASSEYNLAVLNSEVAKQWHPIRNGLLIPQNVTVGSHKKIWWICDKGHEWKTSVYNRSIHGCPFCKGLKPTKHNNFAAVNTKLLSDWQLLKNSPLTPYDVTPKSNKIVWWVCKSGHEWQASIKSRANGSGCPYCSGSKASPEYNLAVNCPDLSKQWSLEKNSPLTPYDVTPKSNRKVWWICKDNHEFKAHIYNVSSGSGCPYCARRKT